MTRLRQDLAAFAAGDLALLGEHAREARDRFDAGDVEAADAARLIDVVNGLVAARVQQAVTVMQRKQERISRDMADLAGSGRRPAGRRPAAGRDRRSALGSRPRGGVEHPAP